jgi:ABC-type branched-subunit amino acid transport system ATPase component/branched-subunit amino acid ABC-type transport system permease component
MHDVIQYAVLGLGAGAVYAMLSQGIVLIYRTTGVLNFAHGALAMAGAFVFIELHQNQGWSWGLALVAAIVVLTVCGALIYLLVMRPLRNAAPLARVIATLGVLTILVAIANLRYANQFFIVPEKLPSSVLHVAGIDVPEDRLWLVGIAAVFTAGLGCFFRFSRAGLAALAVAENENAASAFGWSIDLFSAVAWAAGGAIAAACGVLLAPLITVSGTGLTYLIIPAMAAALLANFTSYPRAFLGGLIIGILQSEAEHFLTSVQGAADAVPFAVIVLMLVVRGQSLTLRGHIVERLPALGRGGFRTRIALPVLALVVLLAFVLPSEWSVALGVSAMAAIVYLSVVVVTGYGGQLSLGQFALAGLAAMFAARLVSRGHWGFEPALLVGVAGTAAVGLLFGLPALRARGINLAIVTLGFGLAIQSTILTNPSFAGTIDGLAVGHPHFFGINIDPVAHPRNYTVFALVAFTLAAWLVCNLRRSRGGRRLIAVRTNERAASSLGINVYAAKLYAFVVSAAIAGLGGIVLAFSQPTVLLGQGFDPVASITAVSLTVVGGVGYVLGPIFGSTLTSGGLPGGVIANHVGNGANWLALIGGVALIVILIQDPDGMASNVIRTARRLAGRWRGTAKGQIPAFSSTDIAHDRVAPSRLEINDLTVRFGGVVAVRDVSLEIETGEVLGLIGPNGAGKTTLVDAVTGFVRPAAGGVALAGEPVQGWSAYRRARHGITRSFQSLELFDDLTVFENLSAASDPRDGWAYVTSLVRPGAGSLTPAALAAIREFELEQDLGRKPAELSHGRRRLVAMARAVASSPSFLLLDEPAAGLDERETQELGHLIRRLADDWGLGILLIEHDVEVVMRTCDRVAVLDFGRKIAEGTPAQVREDSAVRAAYLGVETGDKDRAPVSSPTGVS